MCRQRRMGWNVAMLIPKMMLWSGVDWFDYTEEGGASCLEERGATPRGVVTFTHSCQCLCPANQRPGHGELANQR